MIGVIPNPKKSFQIERDIEEVKLAIEHMHLFTKDYKYYKSNTVLNMVTYEATEFLSVGVYIDITYFTINEHRTEITIEIRRKIGTFNQSHEVTLANTHLMKISELFSESISIDQNERLERVRQIETDKQNKIDEQNQKLENAKREAELERLNNPILYYTKQVLYIIGTILIITVFLYFLKKI
jgi:hypothetical protein